MDDVYDLVVIGAGPAGQVAAELAASFGRRVLIVEQTSPVGWSRPPAAHPRRPCAKPRST